MATSSNTSMNDMLKRYMPYTLLVEEMKKRNYFWNKVKKDTGWTGGTLEVPFEGGEASSLSFGSLTASADVAEGSYVMGTVSTQPELWGTMKFFEKDLDRHNGDLEKSYLEIVPGKIRQFIDRMSERVSLLSLGGGAIATLTSNGANGSIVVDHPERFTIGEKIYIDDGNSDPVAAYVTEIAMDTSTLTIKNARTAGAAVDASGYTTAQSAKVYLPGSQDSGFTSLRSSLLSAANGGVATLYGQTKTAYPFLQSKNISGSAMTESNVLEKVFDAYFDTISLGKGNPTEILMSMKHFKNIVKGLETSRQFTVADKKAGYGFRSLQLLGNEGEMTVTALRDMADAEMFIMDWDALKFHGSNFFERKRHLDNNEFFLERATTGYTYLVDIKFFGDLILNKPSHCGVIYGISY